MFASCDDCSATFTFVVSKWCAFGTAYEASVMGKMVPAELVEAAETNNRACESEVDEWKEAAWTSMITVDTTCFDA